jgi:hypothetical protein
MNTRERFLEVCDFNPAAAALKWEFGYWGETIKKWYAQGLPQRHYPALPTEIRTPASYYRSQLNQRIDCKGA